MNNDIPERISQNLYREETPGDRRNAEVADWLQERNRADVCESERLTSPHRLKGDESLMAELFAIENDCWIEDPYSLGEIGPNGDENECFVSPDGMTVFKVNVLTHSGGNILKVFKKIQAHNSIFLETRYDFVGFTNMGFARTAYPVFKQTFIANAGRASWEEIAAFMTNLGFHPDTDSRKPAAWSNGNYLVWDLQPKNVLRDKDGNIFVVDAEIE